VDTSKNYRLVLCGVAIAVLNMTIAWFVIVSSNRFVMTGLVTNDSVSVTSRALSMITDAKPNQLMIINQLIEADINHRLITNKQAIVIVSMAASFSLVAIGFALFVMGVEAAYTISGNNPTGSIVIQASSPGLACFLFAAVIICFSVTQKSSVKFANIQLSPDAQQASEEGQRLETPAPVPSRYSERPSKGGAQ
jgi:hypothetical protein